MIGHGQKDTRRREAAFAALLSTASVAEAAQVAGIGEATLHRWLRDAAFKADYDRARRRVLDDATAALCAATRTAVDTLRACLADAAAPWTARLHAAELVLDLATADRERRDLTDRLARVEEQVARTPTRWRA